MVDKVNLNKMVDMKRTPAELKEKAKEYSSVPSLKGERFPYGLSLTIEGESLKKLGIDELPGVGDEYHILAVGRVTHISKSANEHSDQSRMEIQITQLGLTHEDQTKKEHETKDTANEENSEVKKGGSVRMKPFAVVMR